jgi:hypothetical protein
MGSYMQNRHGGNWPQAGPTGSEDESGPTLQGEPGTPLKQAKKKPGPKPKNVTKKK